MELFGETWRDWTKLEPMEQDMSQKTKMLQKLGTMDIVTNASPDVEPQLTKWLKYHYIHYDKLIFSSNKWELDYDVFIDDSPSNIQKIFGAGKIALVYNHAWNRGIQDISSMTGIHFYCGGIQRVYNMYHAIDVLRKLHEQEE